MPKYCRYCGSKLEESDTFCCVWEIFRAFCI